MSRVVLWGGPWHDTVWNIPDDMVGHDLHVIDPPPDGAGPSWLLGPPPVRTYTARRMAATPAGLARDRRDPPWWWVYVDASITTVANLDALAAASSRPVVDGPLDALTVLAARAVAHAHVDIDRIRRDASHPIPRPLP